MVVRRTRVAAVDDAIVGCERCERYSSSEARISAILFENGSPILGGVWAVCQEVQPDEERHVHCSVKC